MPLNEIKYQECNSLRFFSRYKIILFVVQLITQTNKEIKLNLKNQQREIVISVSCYNNILFLLLNSYWEEGR